MALLKAEVVVGDDEGEETFNIFENIRDKRVDQRVITRGRNAQREQGRGSRREALINAWYIWTHLWSLCLVLVLTA